MARLGIAPTCTEARSTLCTQRPRSWRSRGLEIVVKGRVGWIRARHSTSSESMLPRPARTRWSISTDFSAPFCSAKPLRQAPATEPERVGTLLAENLCEAVIVVSEPQAAVVSWSQR